MEIITTLEDRVKPRPGGGRRRVVKKEKITEKWKNKLYFHENHRMNGGSFEFSVHFGAVNAFDLTVESEVDNVTGYCEASRISAYPGPAISVSPCVPSNMSMPSTAILFIVAGINFIPTSEDADE